MTGRDPQEVLDTSLPGDAPKPLRAHQRLLRLFVTVDSSSKCVGASCRLSLTGGSRARSLRGDERLNRTAVHRIALSVVWHGSPWFLMRSRSRYRGLGATGLARTTDVQRVAESRPARFTPHTRTCEDAASERTKGLRLNARPPNTAACEW